MAAPELTTTRYVEVGVYIGQFFTPGSGTLANDRRMPCIVAKGDRLFTVSNTAMLRSFRYTEDLTFPSVSPFVATLDYNSNGAQAAPTRLYTSNGVPVPTNQWKFVLVGNDYTQVQILDTAFDPLAQYQIDYQTTSRDIADPIPLVTIGSLSGVDAEIRRITAVGPYQDVPQYLEYTHFFDPFDVAAPVANPSNGAISTDFSVIVEGGTNAGDASVIVSPSASYNHPYNRLYTLVCLSFTNLPSRQAEFSWTSTPLTSGNEGISPTPINPAAPPTFTIDEAGAYTNIALNDGLDDALGVILDFDFGTTNFAVGNVYYLQAYGPGLIEVDPLLSNTNQFTEISSILSTPAGSSTGTVAVASLASEYAFTDFNTSFRMVCTAVSPSNVPGTRTATFFWSMYGMKYVSGSFTVDETIAGSEKPVLGATGITLSMSFGVDHFYVEDRFDWTVKAPRRYYRGKEEARNIQLTVSSVTNLISPSKALYTGGYLADTAEGGFGVWSADTSVDSGRFEINDGLRFYIRNGYTSSAISALPGGSRNFTGDVWNTVAHSYGFLNFSLEQEETVTFSNPGQIQTDVTGAITGVIGAKYVTLNHEPTTILKVCKASNNVDIAYTLVPDTQVLKMPTGFDTTYGDVKVIYRWHGSEPEPGQTYYLSGDYLRPLEMYETPFLFLTLGDAQKFLGPNSTRNDAYMGSEIAFDYAIQGLYVIQVRNAADDGVYTRDDYKRAISAFLDQPAATDLVVLNSWQNIGDQLNVVNAANDPFERHECITYFGAPIGTPIGSERDSNSLVFYSRRTFAVHGDNFAHGTRVLVGSTKAKRTFTIGNTAVQVTLDGSFLACALAAMVASFNDPKKTVLFEQIVGFDEIETYRPQDNAILGANNIIFFNDVGEGVAQIMEDITTDDYAPDTLNLNQMTQKQYVTRDVRRTLTSTIIGQVFPSAAAGVALIEDVLQTRLSTLVSRSIMGQYQDDTGNTRSISANDIYVVRDKSDPTLFRIGYNYFLATVAKRIFGLFTVSLPGGFPR